MITRATLLPLLGATTVLLVGCAEDKIIQSDATLDVWTQFVFLEGETTRVGEYTPHEDDSVAAIKAALLCGGLDFAKSSLKLSDFEGDAAQPIVIKGSLVDAGEEIPYFEWTGSGSDMGKQVSLPVAGLSQEAVTRLAQILVRADDSYSIRVSLTAPASVTRVAVELLQVLHLATGDGTCPSVKL